MAIRKKIEVLLLSDEIISISSVIISFSIGFILGPTSFGLTYYIIFIMIYEMFIMWLAGRNRYYPEQRAYSIFAGLAGYILGRTIAFRFTSSPLSVGDITTVELTVVQEKIIKDE